MNRTTFSRWLFLGVCSLPWMAGCLHTKETCNTSTPACTACNVQAPRPVPNTPSCSLCPQSTNTAPATLPNPYALSPVPASPGNQPATVVATPYACCERPAAHVLPPQSCSQPCSQPCGQPCGQSCGQPCGQPCGQQPCGQPCGQQPCCGSGPQVITGRIDYAAPRTAAVMPPIPDDAANALPKIVFPRAEPAPVRKSFVDPTAAPCFAHAPDYSWISGQVEYSRIAKEWRLRYASVDDNDKYGGRMLLIENHHVSLLQDGQYVRVEGHVVDEHSDGSPAHYRIESFRTLQNPNQEVPAELPE